MIDTGGNLSSPALWLKVDPQGVQLAAEEFPILATLVRGGWLKLHECIWTGSRLIETWQLHSRRGAQRPIAGAVVRALVDKGLLELSMTDGRHAEATPIVPQVLEVNARTRTITLKVGSTLCSPRETGRMFGIAPQRRR